MPSTADTTELLLALGQGDLQVLDHLIPRVYGELRRIARRELGRRGSAVTLSATGLVHEAYLKLVDQSRVQVADRAHFLGLAAKAMRHILVDHARRRQALKRGGGWQRISLEAASPRPKVPAAEIVELDGALRRLEAFDQRLFRVVECRYFGGMTIGETALVLGVAPRTVDRAWQRAKAWLYREIHEA
jgi:RNA polymerase sigma factor (TIGR02999 family)